MNKFLAATSVLVFASGSNALASTKVCYGSTKSDDTKGLVMSAEITAQQITLKPVKGQTYDGSYPASNSVIHGRDGKIYSEYNGESGDYQDDIMVDQDLLTESSSGLLQIRARGEGFFNSVFFCKDQTN